VVVVFSTLNITDGYVNPIDVIPGGYMPPDFTTKPPVITLDMQNDTILNVSMASIPINIKVGDSETARQKQIIEVSYKCDWQTKYSSLYEYIPATMNGSRPTSSHLSEFSTIINLTDIPIGNHTIIVQAQEIGGYIINKGQLTYGYNFKINGSSTVHFSVNYCTPKLSLSIENKTYHSTELPLTINIKGSIASLSYSIDDQINFSLSSNTTLSGLKPGSHTLKIYATDENGMTTIETVTFLITEQFPTILIIITLGAICIVLLLIGITIKRRGYIHRDSG
jgi:hypothetical protein